MADLLELLLTTLADVFGARRRWAVVAGVVAMAVLAALFVLVSLGR